jgi:hypothetical protein
LVRHSSTRWIILSFVVAFALSLAWLWPLAMLFDSDSYYHLAIARAYAQHGELHQLPWARFSAMHDGFGDKEWLFHRLIALFAVGNQPLLGAKLALALLVAGICASVVNAGRRVLGASALLLPAILLFGALSFDLRLIRLRPELWAFLLLLWTLDAMAFRRWLRAGLGALLFALSYTALHALLGLCTLCFFVARRAEPEPPPYRVLLAPWIGGVLGLLVHPQFPSNLRVFYLQNVTFWRYTDAGDIGDEIHALGLERFVRFDGVALLALVLLALALARTAEPLAPQLRAAGRNYLLAAAAFGALFAGAARFSLYAWPFALLALAYAARAGGFALDARLTRFGARAPRTWLVFALLFAVAAPRAYAELTRVADLGGCVWPAQRALLERFASALPDGAKVAAPWTVTGEYMYFAPQGRYLNVLDPVFMRAAHPREYALQRRLFRGEVLDVPAALRELDSEYLAFNDRILPLLAAQLRADPRLEPVIEHGQVLYRVKPAADFGFVHDFRVATSRAALSAPETLRLSVSQGFVALPRLTAKSGCVWLIPELDLPAGTRWEIGGDTTLTVFDGERVVATAEARRHPVLGEGTLFTAPHGLTLEACGRAETSAFYWLRRP